MTPTPKTWEQTAAKIAVRLSAMRERQRDKVMRTLVEALRDMVFVVAMQCAFRAMLVLKRCNY
jgi:hypothetical protein